MVVEEQSKHLLEIRQKSADICGDGCKYSHHRRSSQYRQTTNANDEFLTLAHSVVVTSFGNECILTTQELRALMLGLEECKILFLCVLLGNAVAELHQGFEDHTHGRGLVIAEWVPQLHILNHPSTRAYLSHCGWNSVIEGLRFGQPFVSLPIHYEQGITARLIDEDLKLGVEVRRNEEDGSFTKEDVAKAVRVVMLEEEGKRIKSNVEEISRVVTNNDLQVR
ncbi:putative UDP-rhamnose:rhamnosyltransferase 1 [Cryptomeria japonica]|uniref:putative UDP-rhamnose:rhamnosyltransferase 1 n=1 Tax=Cryptomeria japonica TaxID=3369 RepID=UPI0027DA0AD4|nr:putative UDP-rhamnose:rhamnosyltransferase 1 [Cryptomeria japonica]